MSWLQAHLLPLLAAGSVLFVLLAFLVVRLALGSGEPALTGTDLGKRPAPGFTLTDHRGQTVRLSDFRGQAVALTFIYTTCPDVCPVIVRSFRMAHELLPAEQRDDVALVAVTVDPENDTQAALQAFSATHGLDENPNWYALRGDPATLDGVWRAYAIHPGVSSAPPTHEHDDADRESGTPSAAGGEGHTDAIYLIDPQGRQRVLLRSGFAPQVLADNLAALVE